MKTILILEDNQRALEALAIAVNEVRADLRIFQAQSA